MKKQSLLLIFLFMSFLGLSGQDNGITFKSSDTLLTSAFRWAKDQALTYRGNPTDPVGPWYEAALPGRNAFCMRDASHQSIGAEILGMGAENLNMFRKFAANISDSKKWCSFWEINKEDKPAPVDYQNDNDFWYNLNANFDVLYACRRLYEWTGNKNYISDPVFLDFFGKTMNEYVTTWKLQADSLLVRKRNLNANPDLLKRFRRGFGLPSYAEGVPDLAMSTDLLAAIYQGYVSWAGILESLGRRNESLEMLGNASAYSGMLDKKWWDPSGKLFNTYYLYDGKFGKGEGEAYLLWFDILKDTAKIRFTVNNLTSRKWNVENTSYFPVLLYRNGYWGKAYDYILFCSDPSTKRREYPEVSFGVIEGVVSGLMGVSPDADLMKLSTIHRTRISITDEVLDLPVLSTVVNLVHSGNRESRIQNKGNIQFIWRAQFTGKFSKAAVGKKTVAFINEKDKTGMDISYIELPVKPGEEITVTVKN